MGQAYEMIYQELLPRLAHCNLDKRAARMGLAAPVDGVVECGFLGRKYHISQTGVEPADGLPVYTNNLSVLIHYILSEGFGENENIFVPMSQLTGLVPSGHSHDRIFTKPLWTTFSSDYGFMIPAAETIGGVLEPESQPGVHIWHFQVLPKVPLKLIYYEADDEYPVDIKILVDRGSIKFLEYECLAFMIGCFNRELIVQATA